MPVTDTVCGQNVEKLKKPPKIIAPLKMAGKEACHNAASVLVAVGWGD